MTERSEKAINYCHERCLNLNVISFPGSGLYGHLEMLWGDSLVAH